MAAIRFTFRGQTHLIPESKAFLAGEAVEEVVTLAEIAAWGRQPRLFKLARAFAALAEVAGLHVTPEDVHREIVSGLMSAGADQAKANAMFATQAIVALQAVLLQALPEGAATEAGSSAEKPGAVS